MMFVWADFRSQKECKKVEGGERPDESTKRTSSHPLKESGLMKVVQIRITLVLIGMSMSTGYSCSYRCWRDHRVERGMFPGLAL
jgi:hypothetical protein